MKKIYKYIAVITLALLNALPALCQTSMQIYESSLKRKSLDKVIVRVTYNQYVVENVKEPSKIKQNTMLLEIGNSISKYYDQARFMYDSLFAAYVTSRTMNSIKNEQILRPLLRKSIDENIFINYPKNKITSTGYIPFNFYVYQEELSTPKWILNNDPSKIILGYTCKKATTTYRGRNYTAWYAPDIPLSEGPWKFRGLPGLILRIEDDKKEYVFEFIGIEKPINKTIYFNQSLTYIPTTKQKFNKAKREYLKNPGAHIESTGMVFSPMPPNSFKARPYNPIELSD